MSSAFRPQSINDRKNQSLKKRSTFVVPVWIFLVRWANHKRIGYHTDFIQKLRILLQIRFWRHGVVNDAVKRIYAICLCCLIRSNMKWINAYDALPKPFPAPTVRYGIVFSLRVDNKNRAGIMQEVWNDKPNAFARSRGRDSKDMSISRPSKEGATMMLACHSSNNRFRAVRKCAKHFAVPLAYTLRQFRWVGIATKKKRAILLHATFASCHPCGWNRHDSFRFQVFRFRPTGAAIPITNHSYLPIRNTFANTNAKTKNTKSMSNTNASTVWTRNRCGFAQTMPMLSHPPTYGSKLMPNNTTTIAAQPFHIPFKSGPLNVISEAIQKTAYKYRAIHGERQFHTQIAFLNICQAARKTFDTYSYVAGGVPSGK